MKRQTTIGNPDATQPAGPLSMTPSYFRVDRKDIGLLRFILEAYEGVATLTTVNPGEGIVKVLAAPGREDLVADLMASLCAHREIMMEPLQEAPPAPQGDE
jgi:hypothetical protein